MPSAIGAKLATISEGQYNTFHWYEESDNPLSKQIKKYWTDLGLPFPGVSVPWSAVFVSWCVSKAGIKAGQFEFSSQHSMFVHDAIRRADNPAAAFWGRSISTTPVKVGDIIQNNRLGNDYNFAYASNHSDYSSHSAIVIEIGKDSGGGYALTIGGNESDSVRRKLVRLKDDYTIKQRPVNPFISILSLQL